MFVYKHIKKKKTQHNKKTCFAEAKNAFANMAIVPRLFQDLKALQTQCFNLALEVPYEMEKQ